MFWSPSTTPEEVLMHSAKGSTWSKHKYIRKEGNKYIYKEDLKSGAKKAYDTAKKSKENRDSYETDKASYAEYKEKNYTSPKSKKLKSDAEMIMRTGMVDGVGTMFPERYAVEKYKQADEEEARYLEKKAANKQKRSDIKNWLNSTPEEDSNMAKVGKSSREFNRAVSNPSAYLLEKGLQAATQKVKASSTKPKKKKTSKKHSGRGGRF